MEIGVIVQTHKPALLEDLQVDQLRKQVLVILWHRMMGPELNG